MQRNEDELEKYLSEFQPRGVRPLRAAQGTTRTWMGRLAAAALVLVSGGGGLWYTQYEKKIARAEVEAGRVQIDFRLPDTQPNSIALTKLALENPKQFEERLEAESRQVLPDLQGQQSTLQVFVKK
jgi:hypothetical protein